MRPIYLDAHATTPVDPRVVEAMLPFFSEKFGNAASRTHAYGWSAEAAVELAREIVAAAIGAWSPKEIVFTSGATESNNLALRGVLEAAPAGSHVVTTAIEHHAVLDPIRHLEHYGYEATVVPVEPNGVVDPARVAAAITPKTVLVSVMTANNEVGTLQPIAEIGRITRERGVFFHTDAAQAIGRVAIDVDRMGIDLLSLSAHKIYGPKGTGALYVRSRGPRVRLVAQMDGGGHERGMRSGTLNVPGIVGLSKACELLSQESRAENERLRTLRDRLYAALRASLDGVELNGDAEQRLGGNLNVSIAGVPSDTLIGALPEIAISSGSACTSASLEPSYVLRAMGASDERARSSLRFGIGRFTTEAQVDRAAELIAAKVAELRAAAPVTGHAASHEPPR
ncbi:MAG TPA: aminotransferase class V-fold PLP-dependent enzyme [Polyangiaceae bacterium]|nr:aminotransferase class V-fold PLP-dependent enzyme [Polyangiaceae bacterium]